jgi:hypothetical protein
MLIVPRLPCINLGIISLSFSQSTDTGDYYPEGYDRDAISFEEGMGGSQAMMGGDRGGPALPGMENLGADAVMMGGIEQAEDIPEGMEFIMSSVPDGQFEMTVAASSSGECRVDGGNRIYSYGTFSMQAILVPIKEQALLSCLRVWLTVLYF